MKGTVQSISNSNFKLKKIIIDNICYSKQNFIPSTLHTQNFVLIKYVPLKSFSRQLVSEIDFKVLIYCNNDLYYYFCRGGIDENVRSEAWKYLLGYYDWQHTYQVKMNPSLRTYILLHLTKNYVSM